MHVKHPFVDTHADGEDATLVRPSNWNGDHLVTGTPNTILGFDGSGNAVDQTDVLRSDVADQTISGGANVTVLDLGTKSSGTLTIDCGQRPQQKVVNNGAFTLAAPAVSGSCLLEITNGASAGAITFSGFTVGANTGDALDTTNGHVFTISIWKGTVAGYRIAAHQ